MYIYIYIEREREREREREYFMESAGVRYTYTRCFCIRNLTRSLRSLVQFLIRQQLVRKYRTPVRFLYAGFYCITQMSVQGVEDP